MHATSVSEMSSHMGRCHIAVTWKGVISYLIEKILTSADLDYRISSGGEAHNSASKIRERFTSGMLRASTAITSAIDQVTP